MDKNIHMAYTCNGREYIFLLIINRDNSEKICQNLVESEKPSPPPGPLPLKSSISMTSSQNNGKLGKRSNVGSKGQRDADSSIDE